jgi:hypothetical protein
MVRTLSSVPLVSIGTSAFLKVTSDERIAAS